MANKQPGFKTVEIILVAIILLTGSCMSWQSGWNLIEEPTERGNVDDLIARANEQINQADNKEKLAELIDTYESILKIDPENYEALWSLGRYYGLMGWGYSDSKKEKKPHYVKAIQYAERALYTNPDYKALIDQGKKPWDACRVLSVDEIEAFFYWYASIAGYWKECRGWASRLVNIHWPLRAKKLMSKTLELDPAWGGGHPYYAWAIYYAEVPKIAGGDREKAEEFFAKALNEGPNWLYIRYGRAVHLLVKNKDRDGFVKDLEWVIAQDPHKVDSPYPANVFFQRDAREKLANIDDYF